jgi:hypothetical protein
VLRAGQPAEQRRARDVNRLASSYRRLRFTRPGSMPHALLALAIFAASGVIAAHLAHTPLAWIPICVLFAAGMLAHFAPGPDENGEGS